MKPYAPRKNLTPAVRAVCAQLRAEIVKVGWSETARRTGFDRTALHRAFRPVPATRNPHFGTIAAVADALGFDFTIQRRGDR